MSAVVAVADGSAVPEAVPRVPDAAVFACAAIGALSGVALAITGAAPATANDPSVAAVALVGVA